MHPSNKIINISLYELGLFFFIQNYISFTSVVFGRVIAARQIENVWDWATYWRPLVSATAEAFLWCSECQQL